LFTISCILRLAIVLLMVPGLKNDREATTADLFTGLRERVSAFRTLLVRAYLRGRMRRKNRKM
jgi:hypothetical protein